MVQNQLKYQHHLPELQSVNRINNLPIVEFGWKYAGNFYNKIKTSNNLLQWTLVQAETSFYTVVDTASPAVFLFQGPLTTIDKILCKSLDIFEEKVPSIHLPPQMIYSNTKTYVADMGSKIVRPVLKRADSVKQIGSDILASKYTAYAADKLDGALDVADMYVDKYLPADVFDKGNESLDVVDAKFAGGPAGKALLTTQHVARFSKKLQRRLTRRTLLEAKALKEQSVEAMHVLVYVLELIATDPKLALQKGMELWASLSKDEPENQARPENLEQLIVLLTREIARRVVHLVNFTALGIKKTPTTVSHVMNNLSNQCAQILDLIFKTIHLEGVQQFIWTRTKERAHTFTLIVKNINVGTTDLLERLSAILISIDQSNRDKEKEENQVPKIKSAPQAKVLPPTVQEPPVLANNEQTTTTKKKENMANNVKNAKIGNNMSGGDSLKPPQGADKNQLKATHRNANNAVVSNGEYTAQTS